MTANQIQDIQLGKERELRACLGGVYKRFKLQIDRNELGKLECI